MFVWRWETYEQACALLDAGISDAEVERAVGVPRRTLVDWRRSPRRRSADDLATVAIARLPAQPYAYALGLYLGDGCLSLYRAVWRLRLALDARYPGIIEEARCAVSALKSENRVDVRRRRESACVDVSMYWKLWPAVFPQHGAGPKHLRTLRLLPWQETVLADNHRAFLRGLIHSDGCRYIAHEVKAGRHRWSARYAFANKSDDLKDMFCRSCDALGVRWTRTTKQVSIYRKDSVAFLDEFIGPKA